MTLRRIGNLPILAGFCLLLTADPGVIISPPAGTLPLHLAETGLGDAAAVNIFSANRSYSPLYPLWSDGAAKRRWIYLPPGQDIDARQADDWIFPVGTKLWKEFSFGKKVETRYLEKVARGEWRFAAYAWNAGENDAILVPERGAPNCYPIAEGVRHDIPGVADCKTCHEGQGRDIVLGFNALQLSPERDPEAPNAEAWASGMITFTSLVEQKRLDHLNKNLARRAPAIATALATARARASLGYLSANCGGCHNPNNPQASAGMYLKAEIDSRNGAVRMALSTFIGSKSKFQIPGLATGQSYRVLPGHSSQSAIVYRMESRNPYRQMPPLGTKIADRKAVELIRSWIDNDLGATPATP
ncbi:MAG TPA: hypothetical protein PL181_06805 [bacterium]|nr:hypothetical protein [bacterium]